VTFDAAFEKLAWSKFRNRFKLTEAERRVLGFVDPLTLYAHKRIISRVN